MFERAYRLSDVETIQEQVAALGANRQFTFAVFTDENYKVLHSMRLAEIGKPLQQVLPAAYKEASLLQPDSLTSLRQRMGGQVQASGDGRTLIAAYPLVLGTRSGELRPSRIGNLVLISDYSSTKTEAFQAVAREALSFFALTSLLAVGLGLFFHLAVARRLQRLAFVARAVGSGNMNIRSELRGHDEVALLARSVDQMVADKAAADLQLKESEERYRGLFESTHDLVQSVTAEGRFIFVNPQWKKTLGYSDDDLQHMTAFDLIHPNSLEHCQALFQRVMSGESVPWLDATFVAKDGRRVVVEGNVAPRLSNGKVVATHGFFRDVTQRKEEQAALQERQSRLQAILSTAVEGIITIDERGTIESLNPAAESMFGYTATEVVGHNVRTLMPSPYHEEHDSYLANYHRTRVKKIIGIGRNVVGKRKDGTEFPLELSVSESAFADKRIFTGFVRDLTERQRSEEIEQSLGRIVEESINEIYICSAATMRFVQVNRGARENIGYTMDELRELTPVDIEPEYTAESINELVVPLLSGEQKQLVVETVHSRKDGTLYDAEVHVQMSTYQGQPAFVAMVLDITDRKKSEEALARLNEELEHRVEERTRQLQDTQEQLVREEKLVTLGQLAGSVAHEIRNPLAIIKNAAYFLDSKEDGDQDVRDAFGEINRALYTSNRIVGELLDYARDPRLETTDFSPDEVVRRALSVVTIPANIHVHRDDGPPDVRFRADAGQIERILINLIQNAVHAMPEGGRLTIQCRPVADGQVEIEVKDTGHGIEKDDLGKVFEPLFSKKVKGIGLGLALCKRYAELNHGKLSVESERNQGSTFRLTLPSPAKH